MGECFVADVAEEEVFQGGKFGEGGEVAIFLGVNPTEAECFEVGEFSEGFHAFCCDVGDVEVEVTEFRVMGEVGGGGVGEVFTSVVDVQFFEVGEIFEEGEAFGLGEVYDDGEFTEFSELADDGG